VSIIYSQSVVRQRAAQLRSANSGILLPQRDWAHASSVTITGVSVQPDQTTAVNDAGGVEVTDMWRLFGPRGVKLDIVQGDRVLWDGRTLDVVGAPQSWAGLGSGWHHTEIVMRQLPLTRLSGSGADGVAQDGTWAAAQSIIPYTP
jgi:hypothetical protein